MSGNELSVGVPRLGWFADGDERTPETATLLQDDGERITLTIPWPQSEPTCQYERWFHGSATHFGDDPDRTLYSYEVPDSLTFADVNGPVALVGCRATELRSQFVMGVGHGVVDVRVAVLGGYGLNYRRIHGLRSELPGLSEWVGMRSLTDEVHTGPDGRINAVDVHLESPPPMPLGRKLNVSLRPNFSISRPAEADTTSLHESIQIQTLVKGAREWQEHLSVHNAVRDLADIAAWQPFGFARLWAHRDDDPERVMSGDVIGPRWAEVRTYAVRRHEPFTSRPRFLFTFADIGTAGMRKWVALRESHRRGISPLLSILDLKGAYVETRLVQSGIGLDALGYSLALEAGVGEKQANNEHHAARLERIASGLSVQPPFPVDEWVKQSSDGYNGVKHANRDMPDLLTMANTLRENLLTFRLWVAGRLGVRPATLERNLPRDPQYGPYTLR